MTNYVLNDSKMFADVSDGTAVIINAETGIYYELNPLGTEIYSNIIEGSSTEDVLTSLQAIKGAPDDIASQFENFISSLKEHGIIVEGPENNIPPSINTTVVEKDNFTMTVTDFSDAQELLLADPIHEVVEETGWNPDKTALNEDLEDVLRRESKLEV